MDDTIFARASGAGRAGVAVFRISGPDARKISTLVSKRNLTVRRPALVRVTDPATGEVIDRGLAILFEGPASFTGEDVAEFHLHGSVAVEAAFGELLVKAGARPAEAGEFTKRALVNGKLDLAQVEALADLIDAETSQQRKQAWGQLEGRLSALAEGWRARLIAVLAPLEADIDFPDEEGVPAAVAARAGPAIDALVNELRSYLAGAGRAQRLREGVSVAIIGAPNAGKSSLLNALAGADVAIVSATAGTTRDIVETRLDLGGIPVLFSDTAGLRNQTTDEIEAEGMKRALARAGTADLRIMVIDPLTEEVGSTTAPHPKAAEPILASRKGEAKARPPDAGVAAHRAPGRGQTPDGSLGEGTAASVSRETLAKVGPGDFIVWSKRDLGGAPGAVPEGALGFHVSATTSDGMRDLLSALEVAAARLAGGSEGAALTRLRHVQAVEKAIAALDRAKAQVATDAELAAEDARLAARALASITGAVDVEDVLGEIFSSFCIGK